MWSDLEPSPATICRSLMLSIAARQPDNDAALRGKDPVVDVRSTPSVPRLQTFVHRGERRISWPTWNGLSYRTRRTAGTLTTARGDSFTAIGDSTMSDDHVATLLLAALGVMLALFSVSAAVLLGRNPKVHLVLAVVSAAGAWFCFSSATSIYRHHDIAAPASGPQPASPSATPLPSNNNASVPSAVAHEENLPLTVAGEHWHRADLPEETRYAGDWCHTSGVTQLRFSASRARYRFDAASGNAWQPAKVWANKDRIRVELSGGDTMFFMPGDTPDYVRQIFRKENGLNQIVQTGDYMLWNCNRCLLDDAGSTVWCKGDHDYDVITDQRRARGMSNIPPAVNVNATDASALLGHDVLN